MLNNGTISSGDLALSFSYALDLADSSLVRHQLRVEYVVWRMCLAGKICLLTLCEVLIFCFCVYYSYLL